jgi:hypothetical protein
LVGVFVEFLSPRKNGEGTRFLLDYVHALCGIVPSILMEESLSHAFSR